MFCEISGLVLEIQGGGEYLKKRMANYILPLHTKREYGCDMRIQINKLQELPFLNGRGEAGTAHRWRLAERTDLFVADSKESHYDTVFRTLQGFDDVVSTIMSFADDNVEISILSPDSLPAEKKASDMRDYIYAGQAFSNLALKHKRLVLHSSCIAAYGKAILFSAPSGTGKSTHTGLWEKYIPDTVYINDDTPVLRFDCSGTVFACGSPWSGKTELNSNISLPLAAIVFLERGNENNIEPIRGTEALARLLGETRKLPFRTSIEQTADMCSRLIDTVPIYRLQCDISYNAVETVRQEIFG